MTDTELKYWAFISYCPQDNCGQRPDAQEVSHLCWADWLQDALKTFPIPADFIGQVNGRGEIIPDRIHPIFQAVPESSGDGGLTTELRKALEQSVCLIVICSPRSAQSPQVNETVRYFKQLGRARHILPIVVAGEPNASDGTQPGCSAADECFVPALRHPVRPDGTIDTSRRSGRFIFVDARHGAEKREILANDHRHAEADLEMAKVQLIALLLGVGFNGLWWREQKRHFFDFAEARRQAREAQNQIEEIQRQLLAARTQALEAQNLPREVHSQIQDAQNQALAAQNQAREAQKQLQEFQNKVRDTQTQLEETRQRALAAESKVQEAQHQAREARSQLDAALNQAREAQDKALEMQHRTEAIPGQIQETQNQLLEAQKQARNTQSQLEEFRQQAQAAQDKFLAAQSQIQEFQHQARDAQSQLEAARAQLREAQGKLSDAENQARETQRQAQETQNETRAAQNQIQATQGQSRNARRLTKIFALLAVLSLLAAGLAINAALRQRKIADQALARAAAAATGKFEMAPGGTEPIRQMLQNIAGAEQAENRRRSLDELAAAIPREEIPEALKASTVILNDSQRSQFQKRLLVRLGWENPRSAMTCVSAIEGKIVNDEGLSDTCAYFQLAVMDNWIKTDLPAAFDWVCQLADAGDRQRALVKIIPALAAANPQTALARLNELQPTPDERIYTLLRERWADRDPIQAIQSLKIISDQDRRDHILCAILVVWLAQQPEAALNWVAALPESAAKNKALATCFSELAKTDPEAARQWISRLNLAQQIMQPRNAPDPAAIFPLTSIFANPVWDRVATEFPSAATDSPGQIKLGD